MKERIYSIMLTDALEDKCACALCTVEQKLERNAEEYFLGPSVMEPDGRILTNESGYCRRHINMLYNMGNRLSLALTLETHVQYLSQLMQAPRKSGIIKKRADGSLLPFINAARGCALCKKLDEQMRTAARNFTGLFSEEADFRTEFYNGAGLCAEHTALALECASEELSGKRLEEFYAAFLKKQREKLEALYKDLNEFTMSFDYRNSKKELGENAKKSVEHTVKALVKDKIPVLPTEE